MKNAAKKSTTPANANGTPQQVDGLYDDGRYIVRETRKLRGDLARLFARGDYWGLQAGDEPGQREMRGVFIRALDRLEGVEMIGRYIAEKGKA